MKKTPLLFLVICAMNWFVASTTAQNLRNQSFDFDWKFMLGDPAEAASATFEDQDWRQLDLPHDWSIEGEIKKEHTTGLAGGFFPSGVAWYRKSFTLPTELKGKQLSIYFEGVYMNSEVFLNGHSLGVHPYGYTSFAYDLTPFLKWGEENVIAVRVDNSAQQNCRWYSGSGIYRHVWLIATEAIHIPNWGVGITTPEVSDLMSTVQIRTQVENSTDVKKTIQVVVVLTDANGKPVASGTSELELPAHEIRETVTCLNVDQPRLWSPESPNLYEAQVAVQEGETVWDSIKQSFGIRSIRFSPEDGFQLNGKKLLLNGGCMHHDNGCLGAAAYDRAEERRVELLKAAGFNAVRTSHNPPSESFLDACDRLGLLVIDEAFDGWRTAKTPFDYAHLFDANWRWDLEAMVLRDRNHPSIILWSTGNEIIERTKPDAVRTAQMLTDYVHQLDPSRPVTSAVTTWDQGWVNFDPLFKAYDVAGYNYQLFRAESDHERVPSRIIVHTESYPIEAFKIWDLVESKSYIVGDFVWTAMDYLGESSIGRYYYPGEPEGEHWQNDFYPWHGGYCGDIDLTGWRKPISHYRSMLYNQGKADVEKLYLAVREPSPESGDIKLTMWAVWPTWESWNWPGHEGKPIEVEVYSLFPKVRLYLNNELVGEQETDREREFKAIFPILYQPGLLRVAGVDNQGDEVDFRELVTAGEAAKLRLLPDRKTIRANGQDLTFVSVEVLDAEGRLQPNADDLIQFSIEGPGSIVGVDNANLKNEESYSANSRHAWNGRAIVVVRSERKAGEIKLTASSTHLSSASVMIDAK